jgi:hypothetical protein
MYVQQVVKYEFNEKLAFKKIVGGTMITEIRNVGKFQYKVGCKWEYHAKNSLGGCGEGNTVVNIASESSWTNTA